MNEENVNRALRDIDKQRRIERERRRKHIKRQITAVIIIMVLFFSMAGVAGYILFIKPALKEKNKLKAEAVVTTEDAGYMSILSETSVSAETIIRRQIRLLYINVI
ncbi:MAG: hypothetical protein IJ065_10855 [Eubacterium sp.]|nr:hypothetical protein [Eubacterium sp.]